MKSSDTEIEKPAVEPPVKWHALSFASVSQILETSLSGLSDQGAITRLKKYGRNTLPLKRGHTAWKLFLAQFNDTLAWILLVAAGLAFLTGAYRDTTIILLIVLINGTVGFFQEYKAERILEHMKQFVSDKAAVIRGGERRELDAAELVPGDVVFVDAGTKMPADGYIVEAYGCRVDGFIFSGESRPEDRTVKVMEENVAMVDIENMIFMGESVVAGEAKLIVVETGLKTELGKLARMTAAVSADQTPLQKKMHRLGRAVALLSVGIGIAVMLVGQYLQVSWYENFLIALALAVSVVPEGLPAAISVALSLGMKRLLKRNVLAKRLSAVETLGSVTTICTDKTGTITKNELMVTKVITDGHVFTVGGSGYQPEGEFLVDGQPINPRTIPHGELLFRIATLCNDADLVRKDGRYAVLGDPTEGALLVAARKYDADPKFFSVGMKKLYELPFSSERMRMSVAYASAGVSLQEGLSSRAQFEGKINSYVKGSPDVLLDLATQILGADGALRPFSDDEKKVIRKQYDELSAQALRVLAFAYRDLSGVEEQHYTEEIERDLTWVGMMAMIDPPRQGVAEAVSECHRLGVRVIMITGDYALTAEAIAREAGLVAGASLGEMALHPAAVLDQTAGEQRHFEVISGSVLADLTDEEVLTKIRARDIVFARIAPEQKLRIASILQQGGEVVAMTGDGVNDSPALKKADIGIAMGVIGTDVSKEAADMILLDDDFSSIVKGVEEGRTIFANLRKFVHYVFTSNVSELFTVLIGFAFQMPAPISAVQILAIDLGTDVFPSFALGAEPAEPAHSASGGANGTSGNDQAVRGKKGIIDTTGVKRLLTMGMIMAVGAIMAFLGSLLRDGWWFGMSIDTTSMMYLKAATVTYVVLAVSQMANLFQARSETLRMRELGWFRNWNVWGALALSMSILWLFLNAPFLRQYLHMVPIDGYDWLMVLVTTGAVFVYEEWRKKSLASIS